MNSTPPRPAASGVRDMEDVMDYDELEQSLRGFAQGCRGSMWQSRDETIRLCDAAADAITTLRAEIASRDAALVKARADALEEAAKVAESFPPFTEERDEQPAKTFSDGEWIPARTLIKRDYIKPGTIANRESPNAE